MEKRFKTEQEEFWAGEFGNEYVGRNDSKQVVASNTALFAKVLKKMSDFHSIVEFGPNLGMNLSALRSLLPEVELCGVEINESAGQRLRERLGIAVEVASILDYLPRRTFDVVLVKGVLIHINPDMLKKAYEAIYKTSARYIVLAEYYNPVPVSINYRGHENKLFKRDFCGEMLDLYPDLCLLDYGFVYRRDPIFPLDDISWFVLEKR